MRPWLLWATALAILFPLASATQPSPVVDTITLARADLSNHALAASSTAWALQFPPGSGDFSWTLAAPELTVNWTRKTYYEYGKPTNLSQPHGSLQRTEYETGEDQYKQARAWSHSRSLKSQMLAHNASRDPLELSANLSFATLRPSRDAPWTLGRSENMTVAFAAKDRLTAIYPVPAGSLDVESRTTEGVLRGDFSIYVFESKVAVNDANGDREYESGNWTKGVGVAAPNQTHPVRERHYQLLRLDVRRGSLDFAASAHHVRLLAANLSLSGDLSLTLEKARGLIRDGVSLLRLDNQTHALQHTGQIGFWNNTSEIDRLKGVLERNVPAVPLPAFENPPANDQGARMTGQPGPVGRLAWLVGLPLAGLLCAVSVVVYRRSSPPSIDAAEWALMKGQPRRAAQIARHIVRAEPGNHHAIFLYGAGLLQEGRLRRMTDEIEPLTRPLRVEQRHGLALMLALAFARLSEPERAEPWAREANRHPEYRRRFGSELGGVAAANVVGYA